MQVKWVGLSLLLLSCKYGGSEEDPAKGLEPSEPVVVPDEELEASADEEPKPPAQTSTDSGKPAASSASDAGKPTSNACAPTIATCDPVRNTGCPPLMQCDIDTGATTPAGRCVFFMNPDGGQCSSSFVSVGCAAQNTCVAGQCRKLCYCDGDCAQGETCSDTSGPGPAGAFKLCR